MVNRSGVGPAFARVRGLVLLVLLFLGAAWLLRRDIATPHSPILPASSTQIRASLARLPLSFEPNQGQSDGSTKFVAHGRGYGLYLTPSAAVLTLSERSQNHLRQAAVEMQLSGASQSPQMVGADRLPGHSNYFIGNDPSRWLRNIPQYGRVQYREIYPGIDLAFYGNQNQLEYDFEVSPRSDAHQIELNFKGATNVSVARNGDLVLGLDGRELRFEAPHIYQKFRAGIQTVAGSFVMRGKNSAGFAVGSYDHSRALVIDPVLAFATYLGGTGEESCTAITGATAGFVPHCPAIALDSGGRIYVAGATTSTGTVDTITPTVIGTMGTSDVFVSRISLGSSGGVTTSTLDYVTYIGGASGIQYPTGVGVDSGFNVYVAGITNSSTYPTTPSAFQTSPLAPGSNHAFISKLDSTGSINLYSTYLSGSGVDAASGMALDSQGRVYVIGTTTSPDFPTTIGALQAHPAATNQFFFAKVNPTLNTANSLQYSTYLGGSAPANGVVTGGAVAVDASFNVYLTGGTDFTDMGTPQPWIANAFKSALPISDGIDVWAAKLTAPPANTQQYSLNYGTYFGGSGDDVGYGVATDGTNTYITGSTTSTNITVPSTTLAFQTTNGGAGDAFVAKFGVPAISGTTQGTVPLDYFSYLGGSAQDAGLSIAADTLGNARITGFTDSGDLCALSALKTCDLPQTNSGGGRDAFVARLTTTGTSTTTNTSTVSYLGGSGKDTGTSIVLDSSLNTYITGETAGTFPVTSPLTGGGSLLGPSDAFVAQLGPSAPVINELMPDPTPAGALPACNVKNPTVNPSPVGVGSPVTFTYYIYNQGDPLSGVVFTDQLGTSSGSTSASTSQGSCGSAVTSGTLICTLGTLNTSTLTKLTTPNSCNATQSINFAAKVTVTVNAPTTALPGLSNTASLSFPGGTTTPISGTAVVNDFSVNATAKTATTIASGDSVKYSILVTPTGSGFPESVAISCGAGAPAGSTCAFPDPTGSTISSMSSGPQSRTLAISTTARVTTTGSLLKHGITYALWLPILGVGLMGAGVSRKRRGLLGVFVAVLLGMALLQAGCSSSSTTRTTTGTPAGTYTVTVNATSGSATRTTTVQFTVQ
ncbi:MAG: SBBP repeat-containing protein [Terriglobales bacterium]